VAGTSGIHRLAAVTKANGGIGSAARLAQPGPLLGRILQVVAIIQMASRDHPLPSRIHPALRRSRGERRSVVSMTRVGSNMLGAWECPGTWSCALISPHWATTSRCIRTDLMAWHQVGHSKRGRSSGCEIIPTRGATAASMLSRAVLAVSLIVTSTWDASVQPTAAWEPLR
jgi:hypothetical protein